VPLMHALHDDAGHRGCGMSYDDDHEEYALQAAVEGSGYHKSKGLQWLDLCPHLGTSEKTLLRVLLSLTRQDNPRRKIAPEELRHLVYSGPVALAEEPKFASISGLRRMLRALATLGQITTPEDTPITFSSGQAAQKRAVTMQIWRYPRHECSSRNAFDALARVRQDEKAPPRYPLAGPDMAPRWHHLPTPVATEDTPSDQPGQINDQAGQINDQAGQINDQAGQKDDQHLGGDQEKGAPPSTAPSTVPSTPPSPPAPQLAEDPEEAPASQSPSAGREDECSSSQDTTPLAEALSLVDAAVRLWPERHKAPGVRDRQRLAERVAAELASGGEERTIIHELSRDMSDVASAMRVMMGDRTKLAGWGRSSDPRPDHAQHEITLKRPWCGQCGERTRMVYVIIDEITGETSPKRCSTPVIDHQGQRVACHPQGKLPEIWETIPEPAREDDVQAAMAASLEEARARSREDAQRELAATRAKLAALAQNADSEKRARAGSRS